MERDREGERESASRERREQEKTEDKQGNNTQQSFRNN